MSTRMDRRHCDLGSVGRYQVWRRTNDVAVTQGGEVVLILPFAAYRSADDATRWAFIFARYLVTA